jgi:hypothetical protein
MDRLVEKPCFIQVITPLPLYYAKTDTDRVIRAAECIEGECVGGRIAVLPGRRRADLDAVGHRRDDLRARYERVCRVRERGANPTRQLSARSRAHYAPVHRPGDRHHDRRVGRGIDLGNCLKHGDQ